MSRAVPLGAAAPDYPVTITQIRIDFGRGNLSGGAVNGVLYLDDLGAHYPVRTVAPQLLFDFESGIGGWLTPSQSNTAQLKGINIAASSLAQTAEQAYQGTYAGKWTLVDDAGSGVDWDVRITRGQNSDLGQMLRGSYVGAWVYASGETNTELQIVIRDGNGQICAGPQFPVRHYGWKLIGTRLDEGLFSPYLTAGKITDAGNKFNGFRVRGLNVRPVRGDAHGHSGQAGDERTHGPHRFHRVHCRMEQSARAIALDRELGDQHQPLRD